MDQKPQPLYLHGPTAIQEQLINSLTRLYSFQRKSYFSGTTNICTTRTRPRRSSRGVNGGTVARQAVKVKGLGSTDIDVIGKAGEYIAVGGPAKTASEVGRQLQILKAAADENGVKTMAYFAKGTSESVLKVARKWLGEENVKILEDVK